MGDFDKSIHRGDEPAPYEKIIVNPIEKDKKEKESYKNLQNATRSQIFAALIAFFKKVTSTLSFGGKGLTVLFDQSALWDNLLAFRKMLLQLSVEDESHNPNFTQKLTELWHKLTDDCNSLTYASASHSELLKKLNFLISQIHHYPAGADHTLGYYFTEYAGKEWIPFPFMEMLQALHEEFQANPPASTLATWLALINDILPTTQE